MIQLHGKNQNNLTSRYGWWQRVLFFLTVLKKLCISQLGKKTVFHKNYENDSINFEMCAVMLLMILLLLCCIEEGYDGLESSTVPEMQRSDLAPVILQMKALGVSNIVRFNFLSVNWKAFRIPHSVLCEIYSDMINYGSKWISIVLFHYDMLCCDISEIDISTFSLFFSLLQLRTWSEV